MGISFIRDLNITNIYNGFKNCSFYLQQNFLILIFLLLKKDIYTSSPDPNSTKYIELCKELLDENNTWFNDKSDYTSIFKCINTIVNNTLINIIKYVFIINYTYHIHLTLIHFLSLFKSNDKLTSEDIKEYNNAMDFLQKQDNYSSISVFEFIFTNVIFYLLL